MNLVVDERPDEEEYLEILEQEKSEDLEEKYSEEIAKHEEEVYQEALRRANKHIRKHKREIKRLQLHAEKCVYENNYVGYEYAIRKLRKIYKRKVSNDDIKVLWDTTRSTLFDLVKKATKELS